MSNYVNQLHWLDEVIRIFIYYVTAWLVSSLLKRLVWRVVKFGRFAPKGRKPSMERQKTLQSLISSAISMIVFIIATLASLGLFIQPDTLAWMVGLFSAAFGLGARPLISDYLSGLSFIFADTFAVGEKIELAGPPNMDGVVEAIKLQTTLIRSPSGELYVVPNGEIRTIRNFSRGKFSVVNITLKFLTTDLGTTLEILESLGKDAVVILPNLIEPWQIISPEGMIGQYTELTLIAKARFGKAAEMLPRLLNLVQERLAEAQVELVN
jgi:small conductance mechanosensitive channel